MDGAKFTFVSENLRFWMLVKDEGKILGAILFEVETPVSVKIHPYLFKKFRHRGREMMGKIFEWFLKTELNKITAEVPVCYQIVLNFAKKMGFQMEGINRGSYKKNGKILDQWRLGILRDEIQ